MPFPSLDPLKPYLLAIKLGVIGLLMVSSFLGGCHQQKARDAAKIDGLKTTVSQQAASLRAAGAALKRVNDEAAKEMAEALKNKQLADKAGLVAAEAKADLLRQQQLFDKKMAAAYKKPACAAVLDFDVGKECGL